MEDEQAKKNNHSPETTPKTPPTGDNKIKVKKNGRYLGTLLG